MTSRVDWIHLDQDRIQGQTLVKDFSVFVVYLTALSVESNEKIINEK
jgi:hypothetical protein